MGQFILSTPGCIPAEADRLLQRILASLIMGNTDTHFKNFAMFHTRDGPRLTPSYDIVASSIYPQYQSIALSLSGIKNFAITSLLPKHLLKLGNGFGLEDEAIVTAVENIGKRLPSAFEALSKSNVGPKELRNQLIDKMEKSWRP